MMPLSQSDLTKAQTLFKAYDKNGDQRIDMEELKALLIELGQSFENASLTEYFNEVDTNGDGVLNMKEFLVVFQHLYSKNGL
ncbi:hypothetical protein BGW38_001757 [Lunasporangiospora selenospora]|uniref:EF-hand domain-containing protein n=1 Tax=Lunasporangiospora selenospora TaxID=979761 RepID=A0A9P6FTV2_9FUNG|nr:hypothetical protein BGW38_001757 [Lunasporangiospora selenospora]